MFVEDIRGRELVPVVVVRRTTGVKVFKVLR
jgi:hypothetical protein